MFRLFVLLCSFGVAGSLSAQVIKKYPISNSGCAVYMYCDPKAFTLSYSSDSSMVWTGECDAGNVTYGVITVKLKQPVADLDEAQDLVVSYLDFLKQRFEIAMSVGYGKGSRLKDDPETRGVTDYWQDGSENQWKIKGWTNGKFIGVVYVYTSGQLQETKINVFLDSFKFPK